MRSREKESLKSDAMDRSQSLDGFGFDSHNGPAENILERWEAVKFNQWNILPAVIKNTQSFLLVEGQSHPVQSAVDCQSRLSAKCKHIAEKKYYPAPKVPLASVLISLKQLAFQSYVSSTTVQFFSAVFKDIPELPVLLPVFIFFFPGS